MIRILKLSLVCLICISFSNLKAQFSEGQEEIYASSTQEYNNKKKVTDAKLETSLSSISQDNLIVRSSFNSHEGFIGIVFSPQIKNSNVYYTVVDNNGKEVSNGSVHASNGQAPSLYYDTHKLPEGNYFIYLQNEDFFLSSQFRK